MSSSGCARFAGQHAECSHFANGRDITYAVASSLKGLRPGPVSRACEGRTSDEKVPSLWPRSVQLLDGAWMSCSH